MKECRNQQVNLEKCPCTYDPCERKGICCECLRYHRAWANCPGATSPRRWSGLMTAASLNF